MDQKRAVVVAGHARRFVGGQLRDPDCPPQFAGDAEEVLFGQKETPYKKRHTIKTQIVADKHGEVIAIKTGHPGPKSDKTVYQESRAAGEYPQAARREELGYLGVPEMVLPNKRKRGKAGEKSAERTAEQKAENRNLARQRVYVEHHAGRISVRHWPVFIGRFGVGRAGALGPDCAGVTAPKKSQQAEAADAADAAPKVTENETLFHGVSKEHIWSEPLK